jgi:hypothetical protein
MELHGSIAAIVTAFRAITAQTQLPDFVPTDSGSAASTFTPVPISTVGNRGVVAGGREVQCTLFAPHRYPYGAIGPVACHWQHVDTDLHVPDVSRLWVWVHPAIWDQVWAALDTVVGTLTFLQACTYASCYIVKLDD